MAESFPSRTGLCWTINPEFDDYVRSSATEGTVSTSNDSKLVAAATYFFPAADVQPLRATTEFRGTVSFTAYFGVLDVQIGSPQLVSDGEVTRLFIHGGQLSNLSLLEFGTVPTAELSAGRATPVKLGALGAEIFMNKYSVGRLLGRIQIIDADLRKEK